MERDTDGDDSVGHIKADTWSEDHQLDDEEHEGNGEREDGGQREVTGEEETGGSGQGDDKDQREGVEGKGRGEDEEEEERGEDEGEDDLPHVPSIMYHAVRVRVLRHAQCVANILSLSVSRDSSTHMPHRWTSHWIRM